MTKVGYRDSQANVPGWLAPLYNVGGEIPNYTFEPDIPRIKDGKAIKYDKQRDVRLSSMCRRGCAPG